MIVLGPVRVCECFLLVAETGQEVVPSVQIERTTMETKENISKLHCINCEIFIKCSSYPHLPSFEMMVLFGAFTFNIEVNNALINIVCGVIKVSNIFIEVSF